MIRSVIVLLAFFHLLAACGSSGACGCCGCRAKAKARASKTMAVDSPQNFDANDDGNIFGLGIWNETKIDVAKLPLLTNPNHLFHRCCEERKLPKSCVLLCHFNVYDRSVLEKILVGTDDCSREFLPEMQFCAAQGKDHTKCCDERGVGSTIAGEKCLTFCDQRPDIYTPLDHSYAPCLERFEDMRRCFYENVKASAKRHFMMVIKNTRRNK